MKSAFKIAQAVGAWLQYEFACDRSNVFNEGYMSVPIASVLNAIYKAEVRSEYPHPVLAPAMVGPGRRPEVDFSVVQSFPAVDCVLESKWIGTHSLNVGDVLWDLLRLELVAYEKQVPAFFLLAGRRKNIETFFRSRKFLGEPTSEGKQRPLLKLHGNPGGKLRVASPSPDRQKLFNELFQNYQEVSFPSFIAMTTGQFYPIECQMYQYQVYVWEVQAPNGMQRFKPRNNRHYQFKKSPK